MLRKSNGIFITFEGTEGSGKSTLVKVIATQLLKSGYRVVTTREPGGNRLAEKIRQILLHESMDPKTELFLYEAARVEHLTNTIRPALTGGEIVLCDRFTDSTLAYQGHARGLSWKEIKTLNRIATSGIQPDLTVFLDIDPEIGLKRAKDPNRFEAEGVEFQIKVRTGFLKARAESPKRWFTVKVQKESPEKLAQVVIKEMAKRFKSRLEIIKNG